MELFSLLAKLTLDKNDFDKGINEAEKDLGGIEAPDTTLELDNSDFNSGIEESQGLGDTFGSEMQGVFNGIKTALTVTGIVGAIAGIVNGLKEAVNMTAQTADGIDKGSKKLGISRQAYQEWDHALRQSGSSIDTVKKGIMQFQAAMLAADPKTAFADAEDAVDGLADKTAGLGQDAYEAMRDLGLLDRLQAGEFKNAEEMMNAALISLAGFEGTTDERGVLVRKLFGRGGDELNALLDEGVDGVQALLTEASDLGLIMSDDEINNAVAYGDAMANLQSELDAIKQAFVADIIPVLTDAVTWLTQFLANLNPRNKSTALSETFDQIDERTTQASTKLGETSESAQALIDKLAGMGDYWTLDDKGKKTWTALAQEFIDAYPDFAHYIDLENGKIKGNTDEIKENIRQWTIREKQRLLDENAAEKREAVAKKYAEALDKEIEAELKEAEAAGKQATAISKYNELLSSTESQYGQMQEEFQKRFGTGTVTGANFAEAQEWLLQNYRPFLMSAGAITPAEEWKALEGQAESLRTESEKMYADADAAMENLTAWQEKLAEKLGMSEESVSSADEAVKEYVKTIEGVPSDVNTRFHAIYDDFNSHATGSAYIPYDNYPALLHRGEKVLTATEARQGGAGIDYTALEDRITAAIKAGMENVTVNSYLNGRKITDEVNRNMINDVKNRRYSG